ncbi:MAG: hypothetical protein ACLVJO_10845 [[Clostridium] scindens]
MFRLPKDEELDEKKPTEFLVKHTKEVVYRYRRLQDAYMTDYPIFCKSLNRSGSRITVSQ